MSSISIQPVIGLWFVVLIGVLSALLIFFGPSRKRVSGKKRFALATIRILATIMLLFAMLRPAMITTEMVKKTATLVMMFDVSRSLTVQDSFGGNTRWEAMQKTLADAKKQLASLEKDFEIHPYVFAKDLRPIPIKNGVLEMPSEPVGEQTAIGASLIDVIRRETSGRMMAVIVHGDGMQRSYAPRDTPPLQPAQTLADLDIPVFTFTYGGSGGKSADLALDELLVSDTVFAETPMEVSGQLRVRGFGNEEIKVQLKFETTPGEMEVVDTQILRAELNVDGMAILPMHFRYIPKTPGEYKITLQAEPKEGERIVTNNVLSSFVRVRSGGVKILMLDGSDSVGGASLPEQRAVRWAISTSPDFSLERKHITYEPKNADARDFFDREKVDVVLLLNVDSTAFNKPTWTRCAEWVRKGGGLMMAGGAHSFGPGGYDANAMANLLPFSMSRIERQQFDDRIRNDVHIAGDVQMLPTRLGKRHWIMDLGASKEGVKNLWEDMAPLNGANRFGPRAIKVGAAVLAESAGVSKDPLLVVSAYGNGRVLAFAGDSTEKWRRYGQQNQLKRFWRQTILWLAKKDQSEDGSVWIALPQRRASPGDTMIFTAGANNPNGEAVEGAFFSAQLLSPDEKTTPIKMSTRDGQTLGEIAGFSAAGDYRVLITASKDGVEIGQSEARFLVEEEDLELDNPAADPELMASLAEATKEAGGRALAPEQFSKLLEELAERKVELEEPHDTKTTHWDTWPFFLILVCIMSFEWFLRKSWGMV